MKNLSSCKHGVNPVILLTAWGGVMSFLGNLSEEQSPPRDWSYFISSDMIIPDSRNSVLL